MAGFDLIWFVVDVGVFGLKVQFCLTFAATLDREAVQCLLLWLMPERAQPDGNDGPINNNIESTTQPQAESRLYSIECGGVTVLIVSWL